MNVLRLRFIIIVKLAFKIFYDEALIKEYFPCIKRESVVSLCLLKQKCLIGPID